MGMSNSILERVMDKAHEQKPFKDVVKLPPDALEGVSKADAEALLKAFGIKTIEDLAECKPFHTAVALVTLAKFEK